MNEQDTIAVIGAGAIGAAAAFALAREGRKVLLLDSAEPGIAGASFGNAGHIAQESVQPLPSPELLFGFYRDLFRFGGVLDLPPRQVLRMSPWIRLFAAAAFRRTENTRHLAPLVRPSVEAWVRCLAAMKRPDLLRRHGHYEVAFGPRGRIQMQRHATDMARVDVKTQPVPAEQLLPLQRAAGASMAAGLWFPDSANVIDPLEAVRALVGAAKESGATFRQLQVRALAARGEKLEILSEAAPLIVERVLICAGVRSAPLLAPFGVRAPLQAVRGYHIEMPGAAAHFDAPVLYTAERVVVTPMTGRLRATSFMEFADPDAPPDVRKPARLRRAVQALGYPCEPEGPSWVGSRPVLPDYLPGIGRTPGISKLFYAIGHQHIGLTLAPITAELVTDMVAERTPRIAIAAYDLQRF
jgi:D-amino-acid dehydrogenase